MVNYYYARKEKFENGVHYLEVPIIVNPETTEENCQHIQMVKIGCRQYPCIYAWIPESYYMEHKRDLESQAKADERSSRCLIPSSGGRIRCPESNHCFNCPYVGSYVFDNGHDTSLDTLTESGFDAESGTETESDFDVESASFSPEEFLITKDEMQQLGKVLDIMVDLLAKRKPKYGVILSELRNGITNASEIARRCGLKPNRTAEDVRNVQKMARELYEELMK